MSNELFTSEGKRKYLTAQERTDFLAAAALQERGEVRTFCMVLAYTGCRISEALELSFDRIDFAAKAVTFRTLKQREKVVFRSVPVPDELLEALELVHSIKKQRRRKGQGEGVRLWHWGRTQGTKHICRVMADAGITGPHATPKGLRHGFGVSAAEHTRNPRMVQKWLGHKHLETTAIYMDVVGKEERELAARMWG